MPEVRFGEWLSRQRKSLGLTQKQLANKISCATITLRKIEAEQRYPSIQTIERIAVILGIPLDQRNSFIHFARGETDSLSLTGMSDYPWQITKITFHPFMPAPLTPLIGREGDVLALERYILDDDTRLLTLVGPPGIGKTRLSIEVAHELIPYFSGPVGFINLETLEIPNQLPLMILKSVGYDQIVGQSPVDQLKDGIGKSNLLLVLDNIEHLVVYAGPLIHELLRSCPHLKIITTSREALRLFGEKIFLVTPLSMPSPLKMESMTVDDSKQFSALRLFAERATAVTSGFELTNRNFKDVAAICAKLDGIPLAIELLAAYTKIMSPHSLLSRLNDRLVLHSKGTGSSSSYHQSLYHAFDWSYCSLLPEEQHLLNNLSVFSSGFTLDEIEEAFGDVIYKDRLTDLLGSLVEKSLVLGGVDPYGEQRFTLLTVIQQFASEKLADSGEEFIAHQRHLDYYLNFSHDAYREIHAQNQDGWITRLEVEQDNLRSALNWCISSQKTGPAIYLLTVLGLLWSLRGNYSEISCWLDMLQSLPDFHEYLSQASELSALLERFNVGASDNKNTTSIVEIQTSHPNQEPSAL